MSRKIYRSVMDLLNMTGPGASHSMMRRQDLKLMIIRLPLLHNGGNPGLLDGYRHVG